jgi:integrase
MNLPKGVQRSRKRRADGSLVDYYYWRFPRTTLPDPSDPEFEAAVARARAASPTVPEAGTWRALVLEYKRSPAYRDLTPKVRKAYDRALERLRSLEPGLVAEIRKRDILTLRDALATHAPQAAVQLVKVVSAVMTFAIEREWREANPAARIRRLKGGEHRRWPQTALDYALKPGKLPEPFRRGVVLALYTGQREGDCCAMRWDQYDGSAIEVVPQKTKKSTGVRLWIPVHRELRKELDRWRLSATAETILTNSYGKPWKGTSFAVRFSEIAKEHRPLDGLVFHGLRKAAAARLAEAGCSTHEIAAITGHATLGMIELYTREAEQKKRARAAIAKLELVKDGTDGEAG